MNERLLIPWLFAIAFLWSVPSSALGQGDSGFLRGEGNLDVAFSYSLDTYRKFWMGKDRVEMPDVGRIRRHTLNVYSAYGLTDDIDLIGNLSYVRATSSGIFDSNDDLQDLALHVKWRPFQHRLGDGTLSLLTSPGVKIPMRSYENDGVTAIGDGQLDIRLRFIAQYQWDHGAFVAVETGYDFRRKSPPDEVPVHVMAGFSPIEPLTLNAFYSRINSLGGYNIGEGPFPGVKEEYHRVGGGLYFRFSENLGVSASGWTTIDGRNTGQVTGFSVGMVLRF